MKFLLGAVSLLLVPLLAWPCSVHAVRYWVSVATEPGDDVWRECNSVVELALIVEATDPTSSHQIKICVGDLSSALALNNGLLREWYGTGLNVVFGPPRNPERPGQVDVWLGSLIGRAEIIEEEYRRGPPALLASPVPHPLRNIFTNVFGPRNAFASMWGLGGVDTRNLPLGNPMYPPSDRRGHLLPMLGFMPPISTSTRSAFLSHHARTRGSHLAVSVRVRRRRAARPGASRSTGFTLPNLPSRVRLSIRTRPVLARTHLAIRTEGGSAPIVFFVVFFFVVER